MFVRMMFQYLYLIYCEKPQKRSNQEYPSQKNTSIQSGRQKTMFHLLILINFSTYSFFPASLSFICIEQGLRSKPLIMYMHVCMNDKQVKTRRKTIMYLVKLMQSKDLKECVQHFWLRQEPKESRCRASVRPCVRDIPKIR